MSVILVAGGAGYIGSHTCKALAAAGHTPVCVDSLVTGHRWAVNYGPLEIGDIHDGAFLDDVFRRWKPEAVIHFAAFIQVGESVSKPDIYYHNNVGGTLSLLRKMVEHNVRKLVFSSTCAIFGLPKVMPLVEDLPHAPINPYGATKSMAERIIADFGHAYGLNAVALRYFNASGADPDGEIGELHDPESHLIPIAIEVALGKRDKLQVFGDDYDTTDGTCIRDYVHVLDLAAAHLLALDHLNGAGGLQTFNVGNGTGYSVREIIQAVEACSGKPLPYVMGPRRAGDPPILVADSRRAHDILGWRPRYPAIKDIVDTAWYWHAERVDKVTADS